MDQFLTAEFFERYWERKHLYIKGEAGFVDNLKRKFGIGDSANDYLRKYDELIKVFTPEEPIKKKMVNPKKAADLLVDRATLYMIDYQKHDQNILNYVTGISRNYGLGKARCSIFLSSKGSQMPLHWDSINNFTIQIAGKKKWRISNNNFVQFPTFNYAANEVPDEKWKSVLGEGVRIEDIDDITEIEMSKNDFIYIPRGYWHATETLENSVSISFNFEPYVVSRAILEGIIDKLNGNVHFREDIRHLCQRIGEEKYGKLRQELRNIANQLESNVTELINRQG